MGIQQDQKPRYILVVNSGFFATKPERRISYAEIERQEKLCLENIAALKISKDEGEYKLLKHEKILQFMLAEQRQLEARKKIQPLSARDNNRLIIFQSETPQLEAKRVETQSSIVILTHTIDENLEKLQQLNALRSLKTRATPLEIEEKIINQMVKTTIVLKADLDDKLTKSTKELKSRTSELHQLIKAQKMCALKSEELKTLDYLQAIQDDMEMLQEQSEFYGQLINNRIQELNTIREQLILLQQDQNLDAINSATIILPNTQITPCTELQNTNKPRASLK